MKLTKEEKKEIRKSLDNVLDDIRMLWQDSTEKWICIKLPTDSQLWGYSLHIQDKKITLEKGGYDMIIRHYLERDLPRKISRIPSDYQIALKFLEEYDEIRELIFNAIQRTKEDKQAKFSSLKELDKHYDKEATIEVDFPKTQNMHQIDVYEEDGHTIGILNFGERTVKIITDGDIVLVRRNKEKQPKSKRR